MHLKNMKQCKWKLCFELQENKSGFCFTAFILWAGKFAGRRHCRSGSPRSLSDCHKPKLWQYSSHCVLWLCQPCCLHCKCNHSSGITIWFFTLTVHGKWVSKIMMGFDNHCCAQQGCHGWFCQSSRLICCDKQLYYYYKINRTTK